jgi:gliding motility-associated-like protein
MRRKTLLFFFLLPFFHAWAQNPATIFTNLKRDTTLPCSVTCMQITATVPHIKQTTDYIVTPMQYLPFAYSTTGSTEVTPIYQDDTWSPKLAIGFPFCFYNITYPSLLMGSNSNITFDTTQAGFGSGYSIGATGQIPNTAYAKAMIFGPYHDIEPSNTMNPAPTNRRIEYRVYGVAPARRFIASYNDVAYFSASCSGNKATHQMVLYESTGVIEVYIKDKPVCTAWNGGRSILGIQDDTRTKGVAAPGYNATTWGSTGMNEAYRFTPSGGAPRFKRAEIVLNGNVVATADTVAGTAGHLNLSFPNVCPTADSTAYVLRVTYGTCNNPALDVTYTDTVRVKRPTPVINLVTVNQGCTTNGSITANVVGGGSFQYSINGGAVQSTNVFNNLAAGTYYVSVQNGSCAASATTTLTLQNNLNVNIITPDTSICQGASFTPRVTSNATAYSWTPSSNVNPTNTLQPVLTPNGNSRFIITASTGPCVVRDTINVSVFATPSVNAGPDLTIINGDQIQLQATGTAGSTWSWTPPTGLSATNVLQPTASPTQTTTYTVRQTTTQGCVTTDSTTVTVLNCIDPMTAFTPNGDGVNDRWLVTLGPCLKTARVEVYNRYGAQVYRNDNYSNNWDGTYNGKPVPDGTYYFVVRYTLVNGQPREMKGNVTILR